MPLIARLRGFLGELKRRQVFRVGIVYLVVAWAVIQVAVNVFPALHLPAWTVTFVVVLAILGLPLALTLAWAFDLTPEGVRRAAREVDAAAPAARRPSAAARVAVPRIVAPARTSAQAPSADPEPLSPADPQRVQRALLANLRHELRTPINAIIGYSEMLLEDAGEQADAEWAAELRKVRDGGRQLLSVVGEVLDPERERPGADAAIPGELQRRLSSALKEPVERIAGDAQRLLLGGTGLPGEMTPDVQRIAAAATRLLGMLDDPEAVGEGTGPLSKMHAVAEQALARLRPLGSTGAAAPSLPGGSLLVVDDNAMNRDLLSRQLARQGFSVATAADGRDAMERLRENDYDLVLLDVMMPEVDGIQVLEWMQAEPALAQIPVIMISALDEIDSLVRCIEKGAVDYLAKPFDPVLLRARIGATLEIRRLREHERRLGQALDEERTWSDRLLSDVVPAGVASRLRRGESRTVESYGEVSVVAVELVGLTTLAARGGEATLLDTLAELQGGIEGLAREHGGQLVRTGARGWLVVCGAAGDPAGAAGAAAAVASGFAGLVPDPVRARIGVHTASAIAGLAVGDSLVGGLWGEAVEVAEALARNAAPGEVLVSPATVSRLGDGYALEARRTVEVARETQMRTFRLAGPAAAESV